MTTNQKAGLVGGLAVAALALLYFWMERYARADMDSRDSIDQMLIDGARVQGRDEAANRLEEAREDDNNWSFDEKFLVAVVAVIMLIIGSIIGFELGGPWGALGGALIGAAVGALGAYAWIKLEEKKERVQAEKDILLPSIGGEAPSD